MLVLRLTSSLSVDTIILRVYTVFGFGLARVGRAARTNAFDVMFRVMMDGG